MRKLSSQIPLVTICFEDPTINFLFADLLEARGVRTHIVGRIEMISDNTKVVTEPQFFNALARRSREDCLLVGNKDTLRDLDAVHLSRPLTENKIETAIDEFLSAPSQSE